MENGFSKCVGTLGNWHNRFFDYIEDLFQTSIATSTENVVGRWYR